MIVASIGAFRNRYGGAGVVAVPCRDKSHFGPFAR